MSKTSKKLTVIIICLLALTFGLMYNKTTFTSFLTDSGFDSSSSSDSGSSSSSSSSSSGGSGEPVTLEGLGEMLLWLIGTGAVTAFIIYFFIRLALTDIPFEKGTPIEEEEFKKYFKDISMSDFVFERIADLVQIQYHWMNFDYDKLREKLTDELYNQYEMQLKTLSTKGQKNIMNNFRPKEGFITSIKKVNNRYEVIMEVIISFIDYIAEGEKIVSGSKYGLITMHYELTFVSSADNIIDKCPQCGASIEDTTTQICPYCRHQITQDSTKWVMSKKVAKGQR